MGSILSFVKSRLTSHARRRHRSRAAAPWVLPGYEPTRVEEFQRTSALCVDAPYDRIRPESKVKNISVMTTLRGIGMVMYMTMFNVFGLGVIDLLCCCCCRASTETCYCQYIQDMLLWACMKFCCCTWYNTYESPPYSIQESPCSRSIQVELGKVEGSWSTLWTTTANKARYLNIEQWAHWLLIQEKTNHLCHMMMMSLGQIELDLSYCVI